MGLFGASWEWEEIKKKDAIMGELRKENDRILKERKKENDRILKEQRKILNSTTYSQKEKEPLSKEEIMFKGAVHKSQTYLTTSEIKAKTIACKIISAITTSGNDSTSEMVGTLIFILFPILIIALIFGLKKLFLGGIIFCIAFFIGCGVIRVLYHLPSAIFDAIKIRKTSCYKNILSDIKQKNINDIQEIYVNKNQVLISRSCNI